MIYALSMNFVSLMFSLYALLFFSFFALNSRRGRTLARRMPVHMMILTNLTHLKLWSLLRSQMNL